MPRNKDLKLFQIQLPQELADEVDNLAEEDKRSRNNQVIYLIELGMLRRKRMLDLISQDSEKSQSTDDN